LSVVAVVALSSESLLESCKENAWPGGEAWQALSLSCLKRVVKTCRLRSRLGRARALSWREGRAVRRGLAGGLLLGSLVRVQVAGEVLMRELLGIEVLDLEAGELRVQTFPLSRSMVWTTARHLL
jgi:hypothetical protein